MLYARFKRRNVIRKVIEIPWALISEERQLSVVLTTIFQTGPSDTTGWNAKRETGFFHAGIMYLILDSVYQFASVMRRAFVNCDFRYLNNRVVDHYRVSNSYSAWMSPQWLLFIARKDRWHINIQHCRAISAG